MDNHPTHPRSSDNCRSLKEEEVWTAEYQSLEEARTSIARWIEEYNHDRPHRGVKIALRTKPSWLSQVY